MSFCCYCCKSSYQFITEQRLKDRLRDEREAATMRNIIKQTLSRGLWVQYLLLARVSQLSLTRSRVYGLDCWGLKSLTNDFQTAASDPYLFSYFLFQLMYNIALHSGPFTKFSPSKMSAHM